MNGKVKRTAFFKKKNSYIHIINVFSITFDHFIASMLNKSIQLFFKNIKKS